MIRKAELRDKDSIRTLITEFHKESLSEYGLSLDTDSINETIEGFIKNHIVLVAEKERVIGVVAGVIANSIFDKSQKLAQEAIWYVSKDSRGVMGFKLLKAFMDEWKLRGADFVVMGSVGNLYANELDRFYKKRNFKQMETYYIKTMGEI